MLLPALAAAQQEQSAAAQQPGVPDLVGLPGKEPPYFAATGAQRFAWFSRSTIGIQSLGVGVLSAALRTSINEPPEYERKLSGFGKRYGMRLTGVAAQNAMEAGIGTAWGEDPRYFRSTGGPAGRRIRRVLKMSFAAHHRDGSIHPAYARFIAVPASSFLSNTWRVEGESATRHALSRTLFGFLARIGSNAFAEFWPDVRRRMFSRQSGNQSAPRPKGGTADSGDRGP